MIFVFLIVAQNNLLLVHIRNVEQVQMSTRSAFFLDQNEKHAYPSTTLFHYIKVLYTRISIYGQESGMIFLNEGVNQQTSMRDVIDS